VFNVSDTIHGMKESTILAELADRLKWAREQKRLTQEQLAVAADVSQSTIGNLESGLRRTARKLVTIANVLGVDAYWLETGEGSPRGQAVDELVRQVATLTPAERSVVSAVIGGLRRVSVATRDNPSAPGAGDGLTEYERRMLGMLRQLDARAQGDAEDQLSEILREHNEFAYRSAENQEDRDRHARTITGKTRHLAPAEDPAQKQRKS
jgi:transcriptional regulator with XRE-family HTH domain